MKSPSTYTPKMSAPLPPAPDPATMRRAAAKASAAGDQTLGSVEDIAVMVDAAAPKPGQPKTYRKALNP